MGVERIVVGSRFALLLTFLLLPTLGITAPSPCAVKADPRLSLEPLTFIRVRTTIEQNPQVWRSAYITLVDELGEITTGTIFEGDAAAYAPRTKQTEWKSLHLPAGRYEVVLQVNGVGGQTCVARSPVLEVHGTDHP